MVGKLPKKKRIHHYCSISLRTALYVLCHGLYGLVVTFNQKHRHALIKFKATNQMFTKCNNVFTGQ